MHHESESKRKLLGVDRPALLSLSGKSGALGIFMGL